MAISMSWTFDLWESNKLVFNETCVWTREMAPAHVSEGVGCDVSRFG